jgi:hypothetical protein
MTVTHRLSFGLLLAAAGCSSGAGDDGAGNADASLPSHFEGQLRMQSEADSADGLRILFTEWTLGVGFDRVGDSGHYDLTFSVPEGALSEVRNSDPTTTLQSCDTEVTAWGDFTAGLDFVTVGGATTWTAHVEGTATGTVTCDAEGPITPGEVSLTPAIDLSALPCGLDGSAIPVEDVGSQWRGEFNETESCVDGSDNLTVTAVATIFGVP